MSKILTLDSALPHLWKLKKSMGEKCRFQLFLCTKIMIKNSKFDNVTRFDNCLFLRLIITKFKFSWTAKSYNEDKFYSSLITSRVWTTRWLLLQRKSKMLSSDSKIFFSDRILAEQQQFQQRLAAGALLLFELFELYFDLILDLTKSIFQYFLPSGIQTEMISKNVSEFFYSTFLPWFVFVFYQAIYIGLVDQRYTSSCYHMLSEPFHWQYLASAAQYIDQCEEIAEKSCQRFPLLLVSNYPALFTMKWKFGLIRTTDRWISAIPLTAKRPLKA